MTNALIYGRESEAPDALKAFLENSGWKYAYADEQSAALETARSFSPALLVYLAADAGADPATLIQSMRQAPALLELPVLTLDLRDKPCWRHAFEFGGDVLLTAPIAEAELTAAAIHLTARRSALFARWEEERRRAEIRATYMAEEAERRRIGEELHDGILPMLSSGKMHAQAFADKKNIPPNACHQFISIMDDAIADIRHIMNQLSPSRLQQLGLARFVAQMTEYANATGRNAFMLETRNLEIDDIADDVALRGAARIVQEIIHNTLKYSQANECSIFMEFDGERINIVTEDDGVGFDFEKMLAYEAPEGGRGLKNIQNRVKLLNGSLNVVTAPGEGARYEISIPC